MWSFLRLESCCYLDKIQQIQKCTEGVLFCVVVFRLDFLALRARWRPDENLILFTLALKFHSCLLLSSGTLENPNLLFSVDRPEKEDVILST